MKIHEILDNALPFKIVRDNNHAFDVTFMAAGREIVFQAENEEAYENDQQDVDHNDDDEGNWVISFAEKRKGKPGERDVYDFDKTKSGKEFDVFATLKAILKKFIAEKNPIRIGFTADKSDGGDRARLYAKLFKKNMPRGWSMDEKDDDDEYMPQTFFTMVKEALDKPLPYKVTDSGSKHFDAKFKAGDRWINFTAQYSGGAFWEISFEEQLDTDQPSKVTSRVTGSGNEFQVFATIKAIVDEFITKYKPYRLTIDSFKGESNRARLYQRMIRKFMPHDWKMERDDKHPSYTTFNLYRDRAKMPPSLGNLGAE